jgi:uncharacterized damage-inducible protein DinB
MKRVVGAMVVAAVAALGMAAAPAAQTRGGAQPVSDAIRASWASAKKNIHDTADVVPEASYSYSPVPGTVRTLGQIIGHVAGANYVFCSAAKGEKSPKAENAFESLATKAALVKAWDDSVKYCDTVFAALTDKSAADQIELPFDQGKGARTSALLGNIGHLNEHYGNLVTYMRMKGIVPPTSRR